MTRSKTHGTSKAEVVLVTGAFSGIGHASALHLARKGFRVLAAVRKEADLAVLGALGVSGLVPVHPDLNNLEDLPQLVKTVDSECDRAGQPGLAAIVNPNAAGKGRTRAPGQAAQAPVPRRLFVGRRGPFRGPAAKACRRNPRRTRLNGTCPAPGS